MENCKICGCPEMNIIYHGPIRDGQYGMLTNTEKDIYQCPKCLAIQHKTEYNFKEFYESTSYREKIELSAEPDVYYATHDKEILRKLEWINLPSVRGKIIADIGCGSGSFLDVVSGLAKQTIAVEPTETYQKELLHKKYTTYSYAEDALTEYTSKIDIITSFDVIEHVESPVEFLKTLFQLLSDEGTIVIGTPTDYPHLRQLVGEPFEKFLFSTQHPWIFSAQSLKLLCEKAGFTKIEICNKQMYGLGNTISWALDKKPLGNIEYPFISQSINAAYMKDMERQGFGDYIIAYAQK